MVGISLEFEEGTCSVCGKETLVRIIGGEDRVGKLCDACAQGMDISIQEFLARYGAPSDTSFKVQPAEELIAPAKLDPGTKKKVEKLIKKGGKKASIRKKGKKGG